MQLQNNQVCSHKLTQIAQRTAQKPQPAFHLFLGSRNTPATSSQNAFHHSVTTCQLQSLSLCTDIHQLCCGQGCETTMPKIQYWGKKTQPNLLYTHVTTQSTGMIMNACNNYSCKSTHASACNNWLAISFEFMLGLWEELCCWHVLPGNLPQVTVSSNDRLIYWGAGGVNLACIHFKPTVIATFRSSI